MKRSTLLLTLTALLIILCYVFAAENGWAQERTFKLGCNTCTEHSDGSTTCTLLACGSLPVAPSTQRTVDKKFVAVNGFMWASTILDLESTRHAIDTCGLVELNPLYGKNPSRKKLYSINVPLSAGYTFISYWFKRRHPGSKLWLLPPLSLGGGHSVGWINNYARCH